MNKVEEPKYPRRPKRDGWKYLCIYAPEEAIEELKKYFIEWKIKNARTWYEKGGVK